MKSILRLLTNKVLIVGLVFVAEFLLLMFLAYSLTIDYTLAYIALMFLSFLLMIYVINNDDNPFYRLSWAVVIMAFPPLGAVIYLAVGGRQVPKRLREKISDSYPGAALTQDEAVFETLSERDPALHRQVKYLYNSAHFPIYKNSRSQYLKSGEIKYKVMCEELKKAKRFIFLEYFIIKDGIMWQGVLEILRQKVIEGVDVRLVYDDWGCALFRDLKRQCEDSGIKVVVFNPLVARLAIQMNNRNHRKICVVDGRIGIIGGINIADEYINIKSRFGHWKDTAILIEGDAVHSLTMMFLQFYRYYTDIEEDPENYRFQFGDLEDATGYIQPFADAPTDRIDVGIDAHLNLINNAKKYVYIQTPYLIIGYELIEALCIAAVSGVDVRIIVPGIPDKTIVNQVTKSNYQVLIERGVKIYEYTPGFIHSKTMVADNEVCIVGTTNMDFRSYYMHFECSILVIDDPCVKACHDDVMETIEKAQEITLEDCLMVPSLVRLFRGFVRIFSGLL